eukprot:EG_transcript_5292
MPVRRSVTVGAGLSLPATRYQLTVPDSALPMPNRLHSAFEAHAAACRTPRRSPRWCKAPLETRRVLVMHPDSEDESVGPEADGLGSHVVDLRGRRSPTCGAESLTISPSLSSSSDADDCGGSPRFFQRFTLRRRPTPFSLQSLTKSPRSPEPQLINEGPPLGHPLPSPLALEEQGSPAKRSQSGSSASGSKAEMDLDALLRDLDQRADVTFGIPGCLEAIEQDVDSAGLCDRPPSVAAQVDLDDIPALCQCCLSAMNPAGDGACRLRGTCLNCTVAQRLAEEHTLNVSAA